MPTVDTQLSLSAPSEIRVSLVRADYLATSNIFRVVFEMFLTISSAIFGVALSSAVTKIHWVFLAVTTFSTFLFLGLSIWFNRRAKVGN
ncbi:MAG: hypothetical protein QOH41_724 [Blastocatellia bacterium]|nr:hypothetical protein [Blastocatellia bacterium]